MSGNYASDSWETSFAIGIAAEYTYQSLSRLVLPQNTLIKVLVSVRECCIPSRTHLIFTPQGKQFIDKLFVSVDLLMGRVRFMAGLIEPF